jgi:hypothetical protein
MKVMKSPRHIPLPEMNFSGLALLLALLTLVLLGSGCATTESDNASPRPWNAPASWENGMGGMENYQHQ